MTGRVQRSCPKCGSTDFSIYVYGLPSENAIKYKDPDVIFGGCVLWPNAPQYHCNGCGTDYCENMEVWKEEHAVEPVRRAEPKSDYDMFLKQYSDLIGFLLLFLLILYIYPAQTVLVVGYIAMILLFDWLSN